jgi:hypothetical protein
MPLGFCFWLLAFGLMVRRMTAAPRFRSLQGWDSTELPSSRAQATQKFALIHPVFERFFAVNEHDWNFVRELPPKLLVRIDIHAAPGESTTSVQLLQALFDDVAQVTPSSGIQNHLGRAIHATKV